MKFTLSRHEGAVDFQMAITRPDVSGRENNASMAWRNRLLNKRLHEGLLARKCQFVQHERCVMP
tara:strand:+ start:15252 stop:15443 length:192 start_codon:yes stop_codon:yes gene_type:complete